jgi:hypothetical protein
MFSSAANAFESQFNSTALKESLRKALECVQYYGGAKPGYRTLVPFLS